MNNLNIFSVRNKKEILKIYILILKRLVHLTGSYSILSFPGHKKKIYFQFKNTLRQNTKYILNIIEKNHSSSGEGTNFKFKSQALLLSLQKPKQPLLLSFWLFCCNYEGLGYKIGLAVQTIEYELDLSGKQGISSKLNCLLNWDFNFDTCFLQSVLSCIWHHKDMKPQAMSQL